MLRLIIGLFTVGILSVSTAHSSEIKTSSKVKTYTVGIVPQFDVRKIHKIWRPVLNKLQEQTGHKFVLRGSPTISQFEQEFSAGNFDFAYMNPFHLLLANESQGYIPLVRDVGRKLYGILVVKKDGVIKSIKDLQDKIVAFPAPNALGASLMIRADFHNKFNIKIKPHYVKTHSSVYLNVVLGEASAGGGVQKTLSQQVKGIKDNLQVIYKTEKVAPHPFAAHPRVPKADRDAVKKAMLELGISEAGKAMLSKIPMKKIGHSSMKDYEPLSKMGLEYFYVEN